MVGGALDRNGLLVNFLTLPCTLASRLRTVPRVRCRRCTLEWQGHLKSWRSMTYQVFVQWTAQLTAISARCVFRHVTCISRNTKKQENIKPNFHNSTWNTAKNFDSNFCKQCTRYLTLIPLQIWGFSGRTLHGIMTKSLSTEWFFMPNQYPARFSKTMLVICWCHVFVSDHRSCIIFVAQTETSKRNEWLPVEYYNLQISLVVNVRVLDQVLLRFKNITRVDQDSPASLTFVS